jgi:hypothetical protein
MRFATIGSLFLAFLLGALFGGFLLRPLSTRAQSRVRIDHVLAGASMTTSAAGSQIVGFSCIANSGGLTDCYIASLP